MADAKQIKTGTPRKSKKMNFDQVLLHALKLPLEDRAQLSKDMENSVREEVAVMESKSLEALQKLKGANTKD